MGLGAGAIAAIGAGVGVAGSIGGALINSSSSKSAAQQQTQAADQAAQNQQNQYNQTQANLAPWLGEGMASLGNEATFAGNNGVQNQSQLLQQNGMPVGANGYAGLTFQPTQAQLAATPGYQFDLAQGLQSTQNSNAAQGLGVSGAALKGAANYATGLANNTLTTQQGIFQQNLGNILNTTSNLANTGQNSAVQQGTQGIQAIGQANQALIGGANAGAAGTVGAGNALSSGLTGVGNSATNFAALNALSSGFYNNTPTTYPQADNTLGNGGNVY